MFPPRRVPIVIGVMALASIASAATCIFVSRAELPSLVAPQPIVMRMRRSCATCPSYTVTLTSDGALTFEGISNTRATGVHTAHLDSATVNGLMEDFLQSDFAELESTYPSPGSERMIMTISIEMQGMSKAVLSEDRYGPALLLALERKMDDLPGMRALSGWTH